MSEAKSIAVVGLGNMGSALAAALLLNGFAVVVWNRTLSKTTPLVQKGATLADSVAEAAGMTEVTIVCVSEHSVIKSVVQNDDVAEAMQGKFLLQLGVVTTEEALDTANWAQRNQIGYLEGSILGVPDNIADGTATLICSGASHQYSELKSILAAFGKPEHLSDDWRRLRVRQGHLSFRLWRYVGFHPRCGDGSRVRLFN